jgi:hypothetical protein
MEENYCENGNCSEAINVRTIGHAISATEVVAMEQDPPPGLAYFSLHGSAGALPLTLRWNRRPTKPKALRCNPTTGNTFRQ